MPLLQPVDIGRDDAGAGLDAAVIAIDGGMGRVCRALRVVEKPADVVMQAALVALERQHVVTALSNHLCGNGPLAVQRIGGTPG